jgi:hypothetical protein
MTLTKSDFTVARTCPTKLYYKKLHYPSLDDENPYLEFLADGGYMVEKMAKLLFPGGKELGNWSEPDQAFHETERALEAGDGTLFEATVVHDGLLARFDILTRNDDTLRLIEVKSSSINSDEDGPNPFRGRKGGISTEWRPYLEDVAFQTVVLSRAFPRFKVVPYLCVVDKAKSATANTTFEKFQLRRSSAAGGGWRPEVDYTGNVHQLRKEHVLAIIDVSAEVQGLRGEIERAAGTFAATLQSEPIARIAPEIGQKCKSCEYRMPSLLAAKNGFRECWGALTDSDPHLLDLYRVDLLGGKNRDVVAELAAKGQARLSDVPTVLLSGAFAARQHLQIEYTAAGREYIAPGLKDLLLGHPYPLHFIDFEGSRLAIPYHAGMRAYEQASFQWSCHTIRDHGGKIEHTEWLNGEDAFPNFAFAWALRHQIGTEGTVYIWSPYEVAILREIRGQLTKYGQKETELVEWLDTMVSDANPRIVDLCALAKDHYFHPAMKGSISIKSVLPAVWEADQSLHVHPFFRDYVAHDTQGNLLSPYATLPPLPIGNEEEVVREGTGAMRVYQEMMFGRASLDANTRENYRKLLLQYCKLDTAAMVAIWMHWVSAGTGAKGIATN